MRHVSTQAGDRHFELTNAPDDFIELSLDAILTGLDAFQELKHPVFDCVSHSVLQIDPHQPS